MKKLLIHANNTPLNAEKLFPLAEQFVFEVDLDKDVDHYIHEILAEKGKLTELITASDILYIKVALSANYLEYFGLRLIYHIRLSPVLKEKAKIPICLIAEETVQFIGATAIDPLILFTQGIYHIKDSLKGYQQSEEWIRQGIIRPLIDPALFLSKINLTAPASYRSHHSITNEWSILRWAEVLGISGQPDFQNVKTNIEKLLYYKFLTQKFPIKQVHQPKLEQIKGKGKVLYIDDEWEKGWNIIFNKMFTGTGISFQTLKKNFKDCKRTEIVEMCITEVKNLDPDLVILDLRLSDLDFEGLKCSEMTGCEILKKIKKINPGIQVVIFTASNKVWNYSELQVEGADHFILKESPELSIDEKYSADTLEQLIKTINQSLEMSFLKNVHNKMRNITQLDTGLIGDEKKEFEARLRLNFETSFQMLKQTGDFKKYFNHAYLQLFQVIEDFAKLASISNGTDNFYVGVDNDEVLVLKDKVHSAIRFTNGKYDPTHNNQAANHFNTNFIVSAIIIFRLGQPNSSYSNWTQVYRIRNERAAHFNEADKVDIDEIEMVLHFIYTFIDVKLKKSDNLLKGLKEDSIEDKIAQLKQNFQQRNA